MKYFLFIKKIIVFLPLFIFLTSCSSIFTPSNPESWMERQRNACLPTAIAFKEGLQKYDVWAEVITYTFYTTNTTKPKYGGHSIVAYMYPKGKNQLWTYDFWGSYRTRAFKDDPLEIAKKAVEVRKEDRYVISAEFCK